MMGLLRLKDGARLFVNDFEQIVYSPLGARLFAAIDSVAQALPQDLTITSGADGIHSGPADPHLHGRAFDVRSHDLPEALKASLVPSVLFAAETSAITKQDGGYVTERFFGFLEAAGTENEHFHFQVRHGVPEP